jgi:phage terminase small subunit
MPALQNTRRERFAQLVALGTSPLIEAYRQAGYSDKAGSAGHLALTRNPAVASRIEELRATQQAKTEAKLEISRERITQHVAQLALHGKSEMVQLKAIEVLNKMQGYNEPSSVQHNHVHLQVNAALIEELRSGYAQLAKRSAKMCLPLSGQASVAVAGPQ